MRSSPSLSLLWLCPRFFQNVTESSRLGNLAAIPLGAKLVYPAYVFSPKKSLEVIEKERCTSVYGVPTMFNAMLNDSHFPNADISSVKKGISGMHRNLSLLNE